MVRAFISLEARTSAYFESMDSVQNLRFKTLSVCSRDGKWHDAGREKITQRILGQVKWRVSCSHSLVFY